MALAFQTDRTRIATLLLTNNLSGQVYPFLGLHDDPPLLGNAIEELTAHHGRAIRA